MGDDEEVVRKKTIKANGLRAGLGSVMAYGIIHFVIASLLDNKDSAKVMAYIGIGVGVLGLFAAIYAVFGVMRHRSLLGLVTGLIGGTMCGAFLWGVVKAFVDAA